MVLTLRAQLIDAARDFAVRNHESLDMPCGCCGDADRPAGADVFVSAIVPGRNEGPQLPATIESLLGAGAEEILVVDDQGDDESAHPARLPDDVSVIRHEVAQGPAGARNAGAWPASGEVLLFADSHVRAERGALRPFARESFECRAILCASLRPLYDPGPWNCGHCKAANTSDEAMTPEERASQRCAKCTRRRCTWTGYGGRLAPVKGQGECYEVRYNRERPEARFSRVYALIGGFYAMPRSVFERIGGWLGTRSWGYNEQCLSMKAFFCDVPIYVDRDTLIHHRFKKRFNYPTRGSDARLNRFIAHRVLFDDDTWRHHWLPKLTRAYPNEARRGIKLADSPEVLAEAEDFQRRKVRTDEEFFMQCVGAGGFAVSRRKDGV